MTMVQAMSIVKAIGVGSAAALRGGSLTTDPKAVNNGVVGWGRVETIPPTLLFVDWASQVRKSNWRRRLSRKPGSS